MNFSRQANLPTTSADPSRVMRSKEEELKYINALQDKYVDELIACIERKENNILKETNLTSPTGTGKTQMIAKLINKRLDWFFLITTLSHGQLHKQVEEVVKSLCPGNNYKIFGVSSFTKASILTGDDILRLLPANKKVVWLRDEGHRNTNNWYALLEGRCDKIVNISATNKEQEGVVCNFSDTMMLRTVAQCEGDFCDAIDTFLDVKKSHAQITGYTPCILFRVVTKKASEKIIAELQQRGISYINLVGYDDYDMRELCQDNCSVEAIIYMQKMDVGVDIRRAHVIWLQTTPKNITTTIQCVGRCRRNALFWRDDIDILAPRNQELLEKTRVCHAFYKMEGTIVDTDEYGEMVSAFCPYISIQKLRANSSVNVEDGTMHNGLKIIELEGCTGTYEVTTDPSTGFNVVNNSGFYQDETKQHQNKLTDARLNVLFAPFGHLVSLIFKVIENVHENPHIFIEFGFGRLDHISYEDQQVQLGFYKREYIFDICNQWGEYTQINQQLAHKTIIYENEEQFIADVVKHYGHNSSLQLYALPSRALYFSHLDITAATPVNTSLSKTIEAIKKCAHECNPSNDTYPITISYERWYEASHPIVGYSNLHNYRYPVREQAPLQFGFYSPEEITAATPILHIADSEEYKQTSPFLYTFEECQRVAQHKTICPDKPQHFTITENCRELATIGPGKYQLIEKHWAPVVSVTSLISSDSKLRRFLCQRYSNVIDIARPYFYKHQQTINFDDRKQNSCLGYCVEYYSKSLLYKNYLVDAFNRIKKYVERRRYKYESITDDVIMVHACLEEYRKMMVQTFGSGVAKALYLPSLESLGKTEYQEFIKFCKTLGTQTKARVQEILGCPSEIEQEYSASLPTRHLRGLMDIVSYDTIIDIKVTGEISEKMILQVLAYYYLSRYRSDLAIDRIVVYDAVYDRYLAISGLRSGNLQVKANYLPGRVDRASAATASSTVTLASLPPYKTNPKEQSTPSSGQQESPPPVIAAVPAKPSPLGETIDVAIGDKVVHQRFGNGIVRSVNGELVIIYFFDYGVRILSFTDFCIKDLVKKAAPS